MAKFKVGDRVRLITDCETIYVVTGDHNINGAYFYDLNELNSAAPMSMVPEAQIEAA